VKQYVILGAGLDTFAWRQPEWARELHIIEIDHPDSQDFKRERLSVLGLPDPWNIEFCPIDLESTPLKDGLRAATFLATAPALITWLGVTEYLTRQALEATMAPGSSVVFSFVLPDELLSGDDLEGAQISAAVASERGEPWLTRLRPDECADMVQALGFIKVFHLTPEDASRRYYEGRTDGLRAPVLEQLMVACI